ncbi:MAG: hypothetical protein E7585_03480 [Ruminococcaceae bacterium]|nr:hypothetical protein [Oscillospiraceae bacterium]
MRQPLLSLASFFSIEARDYINFTFDDATREMTRNVILGVCIVMILVSLYALYQKHVPGAIVRAILKAEAHTKETAKTAEELGLQKNVLALFELKTNLSLKKLIRLANQESDTDIENDTDQKTADPVSAASEPDHPNEGEELARFYIPEELKYRADNLFNKKANNLVGLLISTALILLFGIALIKLLPWILSLVDKMIK